ncbi:MAG: hypothetical protein CBD74_12310 [Saprospirales bacterium TMED214]|nr:MAG: hypothetical protein CBD74_12310 [Saprospirales bacterium TMED214]
MHDHAAGGDEGNQHHWEAPQENPRAFLFEGGRGQNDDAQHNPQSPKGDLKRKDKVPRHRAFAPLRKVADDANIARRLCRFTYRTAGTSLIHASLIAKSLTARRMILCHFSRYRQFAAHEDHESG